MNDLERVTANRNSLYVREIMRLMIELETKPTKHGNKLLDDDYMEARLFDTYHENLKHGAEDIYNFHRAIGLVFFGHIGFISDVVEVYKPMINKTSHLVLLRMHQMFRYMLGIIPYPNSDRHKYLSIEYIDALERWVLENKQNLVWDKERLVYVLKDNN